jgi:4-amino-4-deoxy-L-arabinose transferase-like glycosyltransferase
MLRSMPPTLSLPARCVAWVRRHPDLACIGLLLLVAGGMRLVFAFRAPPLFVGGDSQTYLVPGFELARGLGFAPILKRPPLYPLFIAFSIMLTGEDPHGLALLQHLLGLGTVVLTYWLAQAAFSSTFDVRRSTFDETPSTANFQRPTSNVQLRPAYSRAAGLVAGLLIALNGTLIIYERYVMAETLFTFVLAAAALALVMGARRESWRLYALGGALLALATMTRAAAELLLPLVPLVAVFWHRGVGWRGIGLAACLSAATLAGFAVLALPWMVGTWAQTGSFGSSGLGEALFWRGTRETPVLIIREIGRPSDVADPIRTQVRRFAYNHALEQELPSDTAVAIQQRFGYSEAEADGVLRDVAIELYGRQPGAYVQTSLGLFGELLVGSEQYLGGQGKAGGVRRYPNPQEKYGDWWNERVRHLAQPASPAEANEFRRAQAIVNLFQPFRYAPLLLGLLAIGLVGATVVPAWRLAWLPVLLGLWLLLTTAFLSGALERYRYPADPLLAVGIGGGVAALALGVSWLAARLPTPRRTAPTIAPTPTSAPTPASSSPSATVGR